MSAVSCSSVRATVAPKAVAKRDAAKAAKTAVGVLAAPRSRRRPSPAAFAATEALSQTADGVGVAVGGAAAVAAVGGSPS